MSSESPGRAAVVSPPRTPFKLGTRSSKLALAQSELVRHALIEGNPGLLIELELISTKGDAVQDRPLVEIGGNGLFVTAIEDALRGGRIDLAVHSAKDLPSTLAPDMEIAAYLPRADARDVLISNSGAGLMQLSEGARVGTGSPRRLCQLAALRPDLRLLDIRGNVDTRIRKLRSGEYDAIVLAAAGLERLGRLDEVTEWLSTATMLPAVGQGALAVEVRAGGGVLRELVAALNDPDTACAVTAERAFLAGVGPSCTLPVAAYAEVQGSNVRISALIGGNGDFKRAEVTVPRASAPEAASTLVKQLLGEPGPAGAFSAYAGGSAPQMTEPSLVSTAAVLPLAGRTVAVTRAEEQAQGLSRRLQELGARALLCPAITFAPPEDPAPLEKAAHSVSSYDWVIFTSVNGVEAFAERLKVMPADESPLSGVNVAAIGPATAQALGEYGVVPALVPERFVAEAILEAIGDVAGQRILLPRADIARDALARGLRDMGASVDEVTAYRTLPGAGASVLLPALRRGEVDAVAFTSSSTVRYLLQGMVEQGATREEALRLLGGTRLVCIGPVTAQTVGELGLKAAAVADEYTTEGVVKALVGLFSAR